MPLDLTPSEIHLSEKINCIALIGKTLEHLLENPIKNSKYFLREFAKMCRSAENYTTTYEVLFFEKRNNTQKPILKIFKFYGPEIELSKLNKYVNLQQSFEVLMWSGIAESYDRSIHVKQFVNKLKQNHYDTYFIQDETQYRFFIDLLQNRGAMSEMIINAEHFYKCLALDEKVVLTPLLNKAFLPYVKDTSQSANNSNKRYTDIFSKLVDHLSLDYRTFTVTVPDFSQKVSWSSKIHSKLID